MKSLFALAFVLFASPAFAADQFSSGYSSLLSCPTLKSSEHDPKAEIDYFESLCIGRDRFKVFIEGGDARSWLKLVRGSHTIDLSGPLMSETFGQFPNVAGKVLEWRYKNGKLIALIVRMSGYDPDNNKSNTGLVVIGINGYEAKALGKALSNDEARALADKG